VEKKTPLTEIGVENTRVSTATVTVMSSPKVKRVQWE
jgi:hypothetical protein